MGQGLLQYGRSGVIGRENQSVMHPPSLAPGGHDSRASKICQVARDFWLAHAKDSHEIADADFFVSDQVEQAQAGAVGQSAKEEVERHRLFRVWHGKIIYGLTDVFKERYAAHIRTSVYIRRWGGTMTSLPVKTLQAHVAIHVRDVEASIDFYRKLFGIEPSKVRNGYAKFNVANPPLNFTLNQSAAVEKGALSHLGIQVESTADVLAVRDRWQASGLLPRDEMKTECCFALQDKAWVRDPDGNEWEVFAVLKDNLPEKVVVGKSCCASDCCVPATP